MPIIGLDLGKSSFRVVELERKKEGIVVNNFGSYDNNRLNFDSESKEDTDSYANALKNFISEMSINTPQAVVGLDEMYVYMRTIKLPLMSDKELKNLVNYEAEQYIPLPLNEVSLSYQKLDIDFTSKDQMNVQLVAAKKTILDKYVHILRKANLLPKAIEPETLALSRALGDTRDMPAGSIILDIGFDRSIIIISYGGFVRFTRGTHVGGDIITKTIQQKLGLDYAQAEEYKKVYGMDKNQVDGKIYDTVKPIVDGIIEEIKRASIFFTKQYPNATIKRVILAGGTAQMPSFLLYIANNLDLEVEIANPFRDFQFAKKIEKQKNQLFEQGPTYAAALGLALKEI